MRYTQQRKFHFLAYFLFLVTVYNTIDCDQTEKLQQNRTVIYILFCGEVVKERRYYLMDILDGKHQL